MDIYSSQKRSEIMSSVKSKDTKPELYVRTQLHKAGFRFRLHVKALPGKPDIVLPKYKTVIEVRGCFWHRHAGCKDATMPTTHVEFWQEKFKRNVERDRQAENDLKKLGWHLIVVWGCELKGNGFLESLSHKIRSRGGSDADYRDVPMMSTE